MSSYVCTSEPLEIGGKYQYQLPSDIGMGDKEIVLVELIENRSTDKEYLYKFKPLEEMPEWFELDKDGTFTDEMETGDFYYPGMPRIWDEDEYSS